MSFPIAPTAGQSFIVGTHTFAYTNGAWKLSKVNSIQPAVVPIVTNTSIVVTPLSSGGMVLIQGLVGTPVVTLPDPAAYPGFSITVQNFNGVGNVVVAPSSGTIQTASYTTPTASLSMPPDSVVTLVAAGGAYYAAWAPQIGMAPEFTIDGDFVCPANVHQGIITCIGAGGSGGSSVDLHFPGGGGGGGEYAKGVVRLIPGLSYHCAVAQGLAGTTAAGSTVFSLAGVTLLSAVSGQPGGNGTAAGVGAAGGGGVGGFGGQERHPGSPGTSGISNPGTNSEGGMGGSAHSGSHAVRGVGTYNTAFNSNPGGSPGGGASGCTFSSAPGGNGSITIEWR